METILFAESVHEPLPLQRRRFWMHDVANAAHDRHATVNVALRSDSRLDAGPGVSDIARRLVLSKHAAALPKPRRSLSLLRLRPPGYSQSLPRMWNGFGQNFKLKHHHGTHNNPPSSGNRLIEKGPAYGNLPAPASAIKRRSPPADLCSDALTFGDFKHVMLGCA